MLLYTLLAVAAIIVAIVLTPLRYKVWTATAIISAAAIAAITLAVRAISGGAMELLKFSTIFFGEE